MDGDLLCVPELRQLTYQKNDRMILIGYHYKIYRPCIFCMSLIIIKFYMSFFAKQHIFTTLKVFLISYISYFKLQIHKENFTIYTDPEYFVFNNYFGTPVHPSGPDTAARPQQHKYISQLLYNSVSYLVEITKGTLLKDVFPCLRRNIHLKNPL